MLVGVSTPKVLVVDDEENISFLVASALRLADMTVEVAATGGDASAPGGGLRP